MASDLISYALLAGIFIITGLRRFVEKPNNLREIPLGSWRKKSQRANSQ